MDKRRYHRLLVEIPISYCIPPSKKEIETATLDICGTGVAFVTTEKLEKRQELLMYLLLPVKARVELHAKVVRIQEEDQEPGGIPLYKVGVRIIDPIKFDEKEFIKFYAEKLLEYFGQQKK